MIDFHCHLDLYPDFKEVVANAKTAGVYVLSVTTAPSAWRGTVAIAEGCPRIRTALGLHPQVAHERLSELALFEALLPGTRYVGEVGLDGSPEFRTFSRQQEHVFDTILKMTEGAGGRVLSVHSRWAVDEVLDALGKHRDVGVPVLHWFSGTKAQLARAVAMGCWFSVGTAMLRGRRGCAIVAALPRGRVLTETDGPFVFEGARRASPVDAELAVDGLAAIWGEPIELTKRRLIENLRSLVTGFAADAYSCDMGRRS